MTGPTGVMRPNRLTRRHALGSLASLGLLALSTTTGLASADEEADAAACSAESGTFIGVTDRIVDGRFVVLLLEDKGKVVDELVVSRGELPEAEEGDVLCITVEDGELSDFEVLEEETERRRRRAEERLSELRNG